MSQKYLYEHLVELLIVKGGGVDFCQAVTDLKRSMQSPALQKQGRQTRIALICSCFKQDPGWGTGELSYLPSKGVCCATVSPWVH